MTNEHIADVEVGQTDDIYTAAEKIIKSNSYQQYNIDSLNDKLINSGFNQVHVNEFIDRIRNNKCELFQCD